MSMSTARSSVSRLWWAAALTAVGIATVGSAAILVHWFLQYRDAMSQVKREPLPEMRAIEYVSAIGYLEPKSRVIQLSAPMAMEPARIESLTVEEGDWVDKGQLLAVLDTRPRRLAAVQEAAARVMVAEARLAQIKAGAKPAQIAAQQALVEREEASLRNAEAEWRRAAELVGSGAVTRSELDQRRTTRETAARTLERARAMLAAVREVREVDVQHATAELTAAEAAMAKAQADADATEVRAPIPARILRIHAKPGERVGDQGVLELADTDRMQAVAEIYEGDIGWVRVGQTAEVRLPSLELTLPATVEDIGHQVGRKSVFDNDPVSDTDARIVEVRLKLLPVDARRVEHLTNLRVEVRIRVAGAVSELVGAETTAALSAAAADPSEASTE